MTSQRDQTANKWLLAVMLLISGACALTFQVIWIREFRSIFGATTSASAAVLAIFMGGLGVGNLIFGSRIDRSRRPLRFYAFLELGIAASAALSPFLIEWVRTFYFYLGGQQTLGLHWATLLRLLASAAVLSLPTILMGGTMPAVAKAVSDDTDEHRQAMALLYGINTLGAVSGAWISNFVLLELLGNQGLLWQTCLVNGLLGCVAWYYASRLQSSEAVVQSPSKTSAIPAEERQNNDSIWIVCVASAAVGCVFFLMEIVWYRMLGPLLGGTTYTFGLILCTALLGIGLGGAIYSLIGKWIKPTLSWLALTCSCEALLLAIPFWWGDDIALWALRLQEASITSFQQQIWHWMQIASFVILPTAVVAGFQFPLIVAIAGKGNHDIGKHVGWTFASNTVGAITGSLIGGFFLLPMLTAPGLWQACVVILAILSVGLFRFDAGRQTLSSISISAISLVAFLAIATGGPSAVWRHSGIGAGRAHLADNLPNSIRDFTQGARRKVVWESEGLESSIAITAHDGLSFIVDGKNDGNAYSDAGTQIGLGILGPILHPNSESGLVIGLGTGESAGWFAAQRPVKHVDVVELEPSVVKMAELCASVSQDALDNPKLHLHFNDAREFLFTTQRKYDVIISEPSNPYRAGIANLYTKEFYQSVDNCLTDNGRFLQWLQGYEIDSRTVEVVIVTLRSVFPDVQVWQTKSRDMVFVCGRVPTSSDNYLAAIESKIREPMMREALRLGWRVNDSAGFLARYVCGSQTLDSIVADSHFRPNTDDRNLLEYAFAKSVGKTTPFSITDLQAKAISLNDDLPLSVSQEERDKIIRRRMSMHAYLGGIVPVDNSLSKNEQQRAHALNAYLQKNFVHANALFDSAGVDELCPVEAVLYAHTCAESKKPIDPQILETVKQHSLTEFHAIQAIAKNRNKQYAEAAQHINEMLSELQTDPWALSQILRASFVPMVEIAERDRNAGAQFFEGLSSPFAMHRMADERLLVRYLIAENLTEKKALEAMQALEPHVPWRESLLLARARIYGTTNHPLREQARKDLLEFTSQK